MDGYQYLALKSVNVPLGSTLLTGITQLLLQSRLLLPLLPDTLLQFQNLVFELPDLHLGCELLPLHPGQLLLLRLLQVTQPDLLELVAIGHRLHLLLQHAVNARTADGFLKTG